MKRRGLDRYYVSTQISANHGPQVDYGLHPNLKYLSLPQLTGRHFAYSGDATSANDFE